MIQSQFEELARQADRERPITCPLEHRAVTIADEFVMLRGEPVKLPLWEVTMKFGDVDEFRRERRKAHAKFLADLGKIFVEGDIEVGFSTWHVNRELCISPPQRTPVQRDQQSTDVYYISYYCRMGVS